MIEENGKRIYPLSDTNGDIQGVMKVEDAKLYNEDTHEFDIDAPRVRIEIVGRICPTDEKAMAKEIETFVKTFYL